MPVPLTLPMEAFRIPQAVKLCFIVISEPINCRFYQPDLNPIWQDRERGAIVSLMRLNCRSSEYWPAVFDKIELNRRGWT
jgi:hypothetical protein